MGLKEKAKNFFMGAGKFFATGGFFTIAGTAIGAISLGTIGMVGGPATAATMAAFGAKWGAIGGATIGTIAGGLNLPIAKNAAKWLNDHFTPARVINNTFRSVIEKAKSLGVKSDIEYLITKIKTILYQLLKIVVKALGRNNEKVTEKVRQTAETKKAAQSRRKEEPAKGEQNKELAQKKEMSRGKDASISRNDMPSKAKTASAREPVRAGIEKSADKAAAAVKTASKTNAAAMLAQVPVKRMPVRDLSQTLNNKSAAVKPVIGKSAPGKDLAKIR